jgi:hypothetical protein
MKKYLFIALFTLVSNATISNICAMKNNSSSSSSDTPSNSSPSNINLAEYLSFYLEALNMDPTEAMVIKRARETQADFSPITFPTILHKLVLALEEKNYDNETLLIETAIILQQCQTHLKQIDHARQMHLVQLIILGKGTTKERIVQLKIEAPNDFNAYHISEIIALSESNDSSAIEKRGKEILSMYNQKIKEFVLLSIEVLNEAEKLWNIKSQQSKNGILQILNSTIENLQTIPQKNPDLIPESSKKLAVLLKLKAKLTNNQ